MQEMGNMDGNQEDFFWDKQKFTHASLKKLINIFAKGANIERKITLHQFRHTMATLMY
jgi:integrase